MADPPAPELISERPGSLIWWLENDRDLCRLLAARLRRCGWRLTLFHRAAELRRAIQLDEPDLLLLGRRLGSSDGLDLLADLRQHGHNFPVLILSALAEPHQRIEGLAGGANDYLSKPFHPAELIWRLERLLQAAPPRLLRPSPQRRPIPIGPLTLEPARALLRPAGGREGLPLSRGDLALLLAFLSAPGLVLSREHLAQATGSLVDPSTSRTLGHAPVAAAPPAAATRGRCGADRGGARPWLPVGPVGRSAAGARRERRAGLPPGHLTLRYAMMAVLAASGRSACPFR